MRLSQGLQHQNHRPFTTGVTIGRSIEGLAVPVGGEETALAHGNERLGRDHRVHPADQGEFDLVAGDRLGGFVQGNQRRRARSVDRHARPMQVVDKETRLESMVKVPAVAVCELIAGRALGVWRSNMLSEVKPPT